MLSSIPANSRSAGSHPAKHWMLALLLVAWSAGDLHGHSVVVVRGEEPTGPRVVLVAPAPAHAASIGVARQIGTIPLERGVLTIVETEAVPGGNEVGTFLAEALPSDERPDWVWVHEGGVRADARGEKITTPTIALRVAEGEDDFGPLARKAFGTEIAVFREATDVPPAVANRGTITFQYPAGTPPSRQVRYTRQLVLGLLRAEGAIAEDAAFDWEGLRACAPQLIAIYDAEGIGGSGPSRLERIAAERLEDAGIYRVCGEDIREGALAPAAGAIFPGGSGRGIGAGLHAEGRRILRDFIDTGGGYVGVCAGAYFAASGLDNYLHAIRLRHSQPWRRGRAMLEIELTEEGKALFGDQNPILRTRYANGPVFLAADQPDGGDPDFVVLARFKTPSTDSSGTVRDEMIGEAAIGALEYGQGRALIISPHPESHAEHYDFVARAIAWTLGQAPDSAPSNSCCP